MKKTLAAIAVLLISITQSKACDICGCGISNYNPYLFPHLSKAYVGVSYYFRQYHISGNENSISKEFYNSFLATGQYSIGKRVQMVGMIPFQFNRHSSDQEAKRISGIGDITVLLNYRIWEHKNKSEAHSLTAGVGIKLPSGKYSPVESSEKDQQNFQIGTGSIDYILNAAYRYSVKKWVFAGTSSYKYNTQNSEDFRYGDTWINAVTAIYRNDYKNFSLLPSASLNQEHFMRDAEKHILQDHSGGNVLLAGLGLDINTRKIALGLNYQVPLSQDLSNGEIDVKSRISAHLSFIL